MCWRFNIIGGITLIAAATPLVYLFACGVQIFELAPEFVAYRIGNALSVMFGDFDMVRPVQGLPNALLSQGIVRAMYPIMGRDLVSAQGFQLYAAAFFVVSGALTVMIIIACRRSLTMGDLLAIALMALCPWYLGGPGLGLMVAPEYWFSEYLFLVASLAIVPALRQRPMSITAAIRLGIWIAIGVTTKITMIGIVPLMLLASPGLKPSRVGIVALSAAVAYVALAALYVGLQPLPTLHLLSYQIRFYLTPNHSQTYPDGLTALADHPFTIVLTIAAVPLIALAARQKPLASIAAVLWMCLHAYVVYRRPHGTSMTSAALSLTFIVCYFAAVSRRSVLAAASALVIAALLLPVSSALAWRHFPSATRSNGVPALPLDGLLFMPNNYWNAGLPVQALMYNGGLGLRQHGHGPASLAVIGPVALAGVYDPLHSERPWEALERLLNEKHPMAWTRPEDVAAIPEKDRAAGVRFFNLLQTHKVAVIEERFYRFGRWWYAGRTIKTAPSIE